MADVLLNNEPVLKASVYLPLNGAWSAELQVASDTALAVGDTVTLTLPGLDLTARVVRAGQFAERLRVRLTGGSTDWSEAQVVKHYRETDADQVLEDVGVTTETSLVDELDFWTRSPGTTGSTVEAIARHLGFNWRVNPDGTVRIAAEAPSTVSTDAVEISRDPARGLVTVAPEAAVILPGTQFGSDSVGDVIYELEAELRCRYYTEARSRIWGAFDRLVRYLKRDTLFQSTYTAEVVSQAADGTLDLLPDDDRLRAQGLQAVPIRHGLPGVEVEVPAGERVLLAFDGGDPAKPYASLWHEGQVTAVRIGGAVAVALSDLVDAGFAARKSEFDAHIHNSAMGPTSPPTVPNTDVDTVASEVLFTR